MVSGSGGNNFAPDIVPLSAQQLGLDVPNTAGAHQRACASLAIWGLYCADIKAS